jgi:hypothetical protein
MGRRVTQLQLNEGAETFSAVMPSGHNRWFVVSAVVFGIPWLVGYVVLATVIVMNAGDAWRGLLVVTMLTLLTILIDVVAVASIWAAIYVLRGRESITADKTQVVVRRTAGGISIPFRARRGILDRVEMVDAPVVGRKLPHPRLEFRGAHTRVRFGAGLTVEDARILLTALSGYLARTAERAEEPSPKV